MQSVILICAIYTLVDINQRIIAMFYVVKFVRI